MAKLKHSRSKRLVLDIGSSAIRVCELTQTKTGYQLTKYYQREFLADPSLSEEDRKKLQRDTLLALLKEAKVRTKRTIFGVPGQSVFVRNRALPSVPEHKVTQIVRYEIQQQIPFSLDQIALDYQVLNRTDAGGYDVLMAAIKVDVVEKRLDIIRSAKCRVDVVDVCPMAAYNWMKHTGEFGTQGECVALLDLGATTTDIVIEREGQFRFTRSLNIGGNDVTAAIRAALGNSFAEAEKLKRERGAAPTGDPQVDGRGGEIVGPVLNRLVTEVNRSFAYFRSQPGGGPVIRAIVTGGGACLRNMVPFLQRQLGVEVRIAQPLSGLAIGPAAQEVGEHPEQACVALGLALRCNETVAIEINLIPPRILEAARRREQLFYWALSLITLALILATIIPDNAQKNEVVSKQIQTLKSAIHSYDPEIIMPSSPGTELRFKKSEHEVLLTAAKNDINSYMDKVSRLDTIRDQRIPFLDKFLVINMARPEGKGIWFSSVESTYIGQVTGGPAAVHSASGPSDSDMSAFETMEEGLFGGIGGTISGGLMPMGMGGAGKSVGPPSTGFPGLEPRMASAQGGRGSASMTSGAAEPAPPPVPNGIRIQGYAQDPETIKQFIERLKESKQFVDGQEVGHFIEGGVYFDDASMVRRPVSVLDSASGSSFVGAGARLGGGMSGGGEISVQPGMEEDEDTIQGRGGSMTGGGFSSGGGFGAAAAGGGGVASIHEANVTSFEVNLQYAGENVGQGGPAVGGGGMGRPPAQQPAAPAAPIESLF